MPTKLDSLCMERALELAEDALSDDELPVGAVIADRRGQIIARARKAPDVHWRLDHAEMVALRLALPKRSSGDRLSTDAFLAGLTLYTTLEPCVMCIGGIMNCRIPRVVYAADDPYGGGRRLLEEGRPPRHEKEYPDIIPGVMKEEALALLARYFRTTGNKFWKNPNNPLVKLALGHI